jgi:hypothetical protein
MLTTSFASPSRGRFYHEVGQFYLTIGGQFYFTIYIQNLLYILAARLPRTFSGSGGKRLLINCLKKKEKKRPSFSISITPTNR